MKTRQAELRAREQTQRAQACRGAESGGRSPRPGGPEPLGRLCSDASIPWFLQSERAQRIRAGTRVHARGNPASCRHPRAHTEVTACSASGAQVGGAVGRTLGQVCVQFMMVWQRYREKGSCSLARRSSVKSSLESIIQR